MATPSLHQELILQHYRKSKRRGRMDAPDVERALTNPVCGDEVTVQLRLDGDRIAEVRFHGHGCTISQAAASMMAQQIEGLTLDEASTRLARFREMLQGDDAAAADPSLGDLRALAGVSRL
ncbi:MAG: SUF system NifU family Fe-S cluster assembly protein, partial [Gemmatimonadota bacterium]